MASVRGIRSLDGKAPSPAREASRRGTEIPPHMRLPGGPSFWHTTGGAITLGTMAVLAGLLTWIIIAGSGRFPSYMLPSPADVAGEWWTLARSGLLWHHVSATLQEALFGFLLAFLVGAMVGYPLAKSRIFASLLSPYVAGTQAMPILALAPLLVVWLGLGLMPKIIICALIVFFPMVVNTAVGLRTVDPAVLESARTEGANAWQILRHLEIPLSLHTVLAGVRMGLTLSMTGAIVAEFVTSDAGLGYLMVLSRSEYDSSLLFVASLTVVILAVTGYLLVTLLEHLLIDWE